jgi:hypothetical protein
MRVVSRSGDRYEQGYDAGHVDRQLGCEYRFRPGESNRGPSFERGYRHGWMAAGNGIDLGKAA